MWFVVSITNRMLVCDDSMSVAILCAPSRSNVYLEAVVGMNNFAVGTVNASNGSTWIGPTTIFEYVNRFNGYPFDGFSNRVVIGKIPAMIDEIPPIMGKLYPIVYPHQWYTTKLHGGSQIPPFFSNSAGYLAGPSDIWLPSSMLMVFPYIQDIIYMFPNIDCIPLLKNLLKGTNAWTTFSLPSFLMKHIMLFTQTGAWRACMDRRHLWLHFAPHALPESGLTFFGISWFGVLGWFM